MYKDFKFFFKLIYIFLFLWTFGEDNLNPNSIENTCLFNFDLIECRLNIE